MNSNTSLETSMIEYNIYDETESEDIIKSASLVQTSQEYSIIYSDHNDHKGDYILAKLKNKADSILKVNFSI